MNKYLSKQQIEVLLTEAPKNVNGEKLLQKYIDSGYKLEGFNDQPEPVKPIESNATFKATGNENIVGGTAKAIGNIPSSALNLAKNVASAVVNPVETVKSIKNVVAGAGAKVTELALENTDFGQKYLEKANQERITKGLGELPRDTNGKLQVIDTPELQQFKQVGKFISDRYGSIDNFQKTIIEDPVGVLADVSAIASGGSTIASKVGAVKTASKLGEISSAIEPINAISKTTKGIKGAVGKSTVGKIASEVIPTSSDMQRSQVVKALDLTQGDLANISKKTGNDVTDFIVSKNLLKETPEAITDSLNDFRKATKDTKATEIAKVTNIYTPDQVPSVIKGLDTILADVEGVAGLENVASEIKSLRNKTQFTLEDIQNAQYLLDDNSSIYSKIGDAKSTTKAKGLDNIRKDIRSFIENEVDTATNSQTNIRQLNNEIQTSYAIEDAINTRATRNLTRQKISLGDSVVLFGGGATFNPAVGVGLYIGKKIIETPSFRLAFTKALNAQPVAKVRKLITEVKNKNVSPETQKLLNQIANEARNNIQLIESGSNIIDKTKLEKQNKKEQ